MWMTESLYKEDENMNAIFKAFINICKDYSDVDGFVFYCWAVYISYYIGFFFKKRLSDGANYIIKDKISTSELCGFNFYNIKLFLELTKLINNKG